MLTTPEKYFFIIAIVISLLLAMRAINRIRRIIFRNARGVPGLQAIINRSVEAFIKTLSLETVFRQRPVTSSFHALVAWGFMFYLLVNIGDVLQGFLTNFIFLGRGPVGVAYRLLADVLSVGVLVGITALLIRRFIGRPKELAFNEKVLLHPGVSSGGIRRDSAIVGAFILAHVGARLLGESFSLAMTGSDWWQPFANLLSKLWTGSDPHYLTVAHHAAWWLALGLILVFIPYFPYTKHIHIFIAPLNFLLKPRGNSLVVMKLLDLDEEKYGAIDLEELDWPQLMDAYACIQCNRCQDVCPSYAAGTTLSPAALEINKRYQLNQKGFTPNNRLTDFAIKEEAVWSCTSCGACVEVCPVGNEPVRDILDIRRNLTLVQGNLPIKGATPLRNIAILSNPWGGAPSERTAWAERLNVRTMLEVKTAELLYWVGCSSAYEPRNQSIARSMVRLLDKADVDFAILGTEEGCTGDHARRLGDEALFQKMARRNINTISRYSFTRIVTHCSHCFNVLKNEYPALFNATDLSKESIAHWKVAHHTQLLDELVKSKRLQPSHEISEVVTYHDSCYLGRYNGEFDAPRELLRSIPGVDMKEMPRSRENGLCCGGGGGCSWVDMPAESRIADIRMEEALALNPTVIASACPFCVTMFEGSALKSTTSVKVKDVAELLDESVNQS
ncbi:MAG: (Fe-S)-binding protein [Gammaproteobacteria bacterium]|nr:(Fe-S)-binding protein [Gammaproteobacteria bacterium]